VYNYLNKAGVRKDEKKDIRKKKEGVRNKTKDKRKQGTAK